MARTWAAIARRFQQKRRSNANPLLCLMRSAGMYFPPLLLYKRPKRIGEFAAREKR